MSAEHDPGSGNEESEPTGESEPERASGVDDLLSRPLGNCDDRDHSAAASVPPERESGSGEAPPTAPGEGARSADVEPPPRRGRRAPHAKSANMLPGRQVRRSGLERLVVRLIATCGVVGIGVAIAAIMVSSKSQGWLVGLVVAIVSVVLSALLWSSRQL